jgi:transcriptional regulator with XRE-family HTH domain
MQRGSLGLTQSQLANALQVKRAYVGAVESCTVNVSLETIQRFKGVLWPDAAHIDLKQQVGRKIAEARAGSLSQEVLSDKTRLSVPFISSVERGISNTSLDQIENLASALNIDSLQWMGRDWLELAPKQFAEWLASVAATSNFAESSSRLRKSVCDELKSLRKSAGMTQGALADALGMTKSRVSIIENAKSNLTLSTLENFVTELVSNGRAHRSISLVAHVGTRVVEARKQRNLNQSELGKLSGLGRATISRIERADSETSLDHLEQIANALDIDARSLIDVIFPSASLANTSGKNAFANAVATLRKKEEA